ncbi:MAG: single-stranded DNA-binding protein [Bacilli bacterium]|nr:single-stranded DNA-binding protein [Bacilli bacterium]
MNSVQLIGRLTKDLDLKYTQTGKAVATGTLAVNRRFKNAQGESEADFINIQIWDKSAENLANFTRKGSQIGVNGRIQTRNYENKEGQRVYVTEIVVENFTLLEKKSDNAPQQSSRQPQRQQSPDPFASHGHSIDISDEDLPF